VNIASYLGLSQPGKFDVGDSEIAKISQKLAAMTPIKDDPET
jgi:hypothetical protein